MVLLPVSHHSLNGFMVYRSESMDARKARVGELVLGPAPRMSSIRYVRSI